VIWLYAIVGGLRGLPPVEGIGGSPLTVYDCAGLDAVTTVHEAARIEPSEETVLAHARVVEALVPFASSLLPARFGVAFEDFPEVEAALCERGRELRHSLELVQGSVELGLRVVGEELERASAASSGRAYMESRRAQVVSADRLAGDLHACLAEQARAAVRNDRPDGRLVLSGAYLLEPAAIPAFQEAVEALESKHPALTFALTGPWPPYSFAGMEAA
jgi:gas vesicle protein GvpL/GvpF